MAGTGLIKPISFFTKDNFHRLCDQLAVADRQLKQIIHQYGYPPMWSRPNSFASLVHIILEQQVSLASAKAAFTKLRQKIGTITPQKLLALTDEELRACYFSRQKTVYTRHLAKMIQEGKVELKKYRHCPDDEIRTQLLAVKGIGNWTVDIYLLFTLQRTDVFPVGDLAMINALKEVKGLGSQTTKEDIIEIAESWQPNRSVATMLLWHYYLCKRNIRT